jgi:hypothetical protein
MVGRVLLGLLLFAAFAPGEDITLERPPASPHAKRLREEAEKLWTPHAPLLETLKKGQAADPEALARALADLAEAVLRFERSLQIEWNQATNATLADVVRGWFKVRAALVALGQAPADATGEARKAQLREGRRFLVDYLKARKHESQVRRCDRCDGQKDLLSRFGDRTACPRCQRLGMLPVPQAILEAHWLPRSPLYRALGRNASSMEQKLRFAVRDPARLGPFLRTASIDGPIDDQGLFVRVKVKEQVVADPGAAKAEKVDSEYVVFNVGKIWYLYDAQADRDLFTLPEPAAKTE